MASLEHVEVLRSGVDRWNKWRVEHAAVVPDLSRTNLSGLDLSAVDLSEANLSGADLSGADLSGADLSGADLSGADLSRALLIETNLSNAYLRNCAVYGASVWDVELTGTMQNELLITPPGQPSITVDSLEVAQFIYMILPNQKMRQVIDTLTSKLVLLLGRFTAERKRVLDALRMALREHNYASILFDFEGSSERNFTETITLLAGMSRFIIADLTDPSSIPLELQAIVPNVHVPIQPLICEGNHPFAMFVDYQVYPWVLPIVQYEVLDELLRQLHARIIGPAEAKLVELRALRQPRYELGY